MNEEEFCDLLRGLDSIIESLARAIELEGMPVDQALAGLAELSAEPDEPER